MGEDPSAGRPPGAAVTAPASQGSGSAAALRADIERTRLALGDTVEALAGKTDVKARAKGKAAEVRGKVTAKLHSARESGGAGGNGGGPSGASAAVEQARAKAQANPVPTAAAAALLGGFLLGRITKRR
jgi:ElaB/YqjD/DUF883 family membrane-anchored ribosome-binding protein